MRQTRTVHTRRGLRFLSIAVLLVDAEMNTHTVGQNQRFEWPKHTVIVDGIKVVNHTRYSSDNDLSNKLCRANSAVVGENAGSDHFNRIPFLTLLTKQIGRNSNMRIQIIRSK